MNLVCYLFDKIPEYEKAIYAMVAKYHSDMGEWGQLAPVARMETVRRIFIARTRGAYCMLRRCTNIETAYREIKTLLANPVAQEIELMSDAVINQRYK